ncbi:THUMP domain-containing protein [Castellaniella sp.]|uniref:THUMP domain-containing class I SAM-dependent RNA methyltransferase n=1 Tax=Castellaniella sp. TaxID=1955812 RepID=UPI00356A92D6
MAQSKKTTLRLKTTPAAADTDKPAPRQRSGARAHQAARQERARRAGVGATGVSTPAAPVEKATARPAARPEPDPPHRPVARPATRPHDRPAGGHHRQRLARPQETFKAFAPCPQGLEHSLAQELGTLGLAAVAAGRAGCHFEAAWPDLLRANLHSRLATRILVQVAQAPVYNEDDILSLARATPWERWFGPEHTLRVDTSAVRSPMRSLQYCNLRAKDGICDRLREREGARPDIDTVRPDARVHLFLDARQATLYLDLSGESLFKRGWRLDKGAAPLRENLAAGLLMLSGWPTDAALLDPFCGSGTILIEAAWMALGVPPGIWRPFAFERLRDHDAHLWRDIKDDARSRIATRLAQPLVGTDHDPAAIDAARANVQRAHLAPDSIRFEVSDVREVPPPAERGWIVTNPPYGERLGLADADVLWAAWASWLKQHYGGWQLNIISDDRTLPGRLRLKARRRHPLYNGAIECRLFQFDLVSHADRDKDDTA